ncbi:MAG: hypothetical protein K2X81_13525, partial [Candidatus Obscuribacterales bacterium]|nr:hypothetical protein [Candidatus Obscuribacterales bacterium]
MRFKKIFLVSFGVVVALMSLYLSIVFRSCMQYKTKVENAIQAAKIAEQHVSRRLSEPRYSKKWPFGENIYFARSMFDPEISTLDSIEHTACASVPFALPSLSEKENSKNLEREKKLRKGWMVVFPY